MTNRTPSPLPQPTSLYRLYAPDGELLYVGIAGNPGRRFEQHRSTKPWWGDVDQVTLDHYPTRAAASKAELLTIRTERPRYNIVGNTSDGELLGIVPSAEQSTGWTFESRKSGLRRTRDLCLFWELNGDPISDGYLPTEIDAYDLWLRWLDQISDSPEHYFTTPMGDGWLPILWLVHSPTGGVAEFAPFQTHPLQPPYDFLTYFTWPERNGEQLNWLSLPVVDKQWTPDRGDKGGFIQEVTRWKPSPLQSFVQLDQLAYAAGLAALPVRPR